MSSGRLNPNMMKCVLAILIPLMSAVVGVVVSAKSRSERVSIIDLTNGADHALLIGGWNGKRWVRDTEYHGQVRGGERYRFYGLASQGGEAAGGKAKLSEASGSAWQIEVKNPPRSTESLIGLTGAWNALTRKALLVKELAPYRVLVANVLKQRGLKQTPVNITRVIRVDLDGDGSEEEIVSATTPRLAKDVGEALMRAEKSDYSLVLVRSKSHGRYTTTVLEGAYWYAPNATSTINEIAGALDLNGDGKLEIVVRTRYYEGGGVRVYEFVAGEPREVLSAIDGA